MKPLFSLLPIIAALFVIERAFIAAETFTEGMRVFPDTVTLKPGEYVWEPERAPEGPLLIVASVTEQVAYVYRNGIRIADYPDSHGCVRLPLEFSKLLFGVTMKGATVIIANTHSAPATTVHPGLFFSRSGQESEPIAAGQFDWNPDNSPTGPISVIISSADKTVYVYRNGVEIGRAGIPNPQVVSPLNDLVFSALQGTDADGHLRWAEVTATGESKSNENIFLASQESGLPAAFLDKAKAVITPGATLIFTDRPVDPTTQSAPNFQILVAQKDKPVKT